jgi:tRNA dimethylallyltransferase
MQNKLKKLDPKYYKNVDLQNHRRIIRALEVSVFTRKPFSSFLCGNETEKYKNHSIALNLDRNILYEKINSRVNKMLDNGLIDEVKELLPHEHLNSLNTIGYKEIFKHFNGELNFQETIELIKTNSRRFAKRQLSWLKNNGNHYWLESTESNKNNIEKLFQQIF